MVRCQNCNREIPSYSVFCPYCGLEVSRLRIEPKKNLVDILKSRSNELALNLKKISNRAEPFLAKINETFAEYTIHDVRHSKTVVEIMSWFIPKSLIRLLNDYEIYFLLAAAYLHDIGMVNLPSLFENDKEFESFRAKKEAKGYSREEIVREYIRDHHHLRSEKFITKHFLELSIEDEVQGRIIGRICRGHRDDLQDETLYKSKEMYTAKGIPVNVRLLSAILKIADELDLSFERAPRIIYEMLYPNDPLSRSHWERHLSVGGIGLDPENPMCIVISAECKNHKIHRSLRRFETKIQAMLDELPNYLHQYKASMTDLPSIVKLDIDAISYKPIDIKFALQEKKITELLMGDKIYDRKDVFVRELLQNSIDSCRLKAHIVKNFKPDIHVKYYDGKVVVSDNGTGMDGYQIERYLSRIGSCFYHSPDFPEEIPFTPISRFGVGILSCFMAGEGIIIETKTEESDPWRVEIDDIGDYFYITTGRRTESGTEIIVKLKPSELDIRARDVEQAVKYYAHHLEFPIKLTISGRKERTIRRASITPILRKHTTAQLTYNCDFRVRKFKEPNIEGTLAITCKKDRSGKLTLLDRSDFERGSMIAVKLLLSGIFVSNEGITIGDAPYIMPYLSGILIDVNIKDLDPDLNLARTKILPGKKLEHLSSLLGDLLLDEIEEWFGKIEEEEGMAKVFDLSRRLFRFYIYRYPDISEAEYKIYRKFLNRLYYFPVFSIDGIEYLTLPELIKTKEQIVIIPNTSYLLLRSSDETRLRYFEEIFFNSSWAKPNILYLFDPPGFILESIKTKKRKHFKISNLVRMTKRKVIKDDKGYFPKTWEVVKFDNYKTHRLLEEFGLYSHVYINVENKFMQLLLSKGEQVISSKQRADAVKSLFKGLRSRVRADFENVRQEQRNILAWFKEASIISNTDDFLLTPQDFPPDWI